MSFPRMETYYPNMGMVSIDTLKTDQTGALKIFEKLSGRLE